MKKFVVANWKMKMNKENVVTWINEWNTNLPGSDALEIIISPTFLHIPLAESIKNVNIAAQDISRFDKGSHTGEVGSFQAKEYCKYCIVGHSERQEGYELVMQKADKCLENNITPIICFTDPEKANQYYKKGSIIAWEDPDNIAVDGKFRPKDPKEISAEFERMGLALGEEVTIIYGGSVNRDNILDLKSIKNLAGVLVGTASLDANHFIDICEKII